MDKKFILDLIKVSAPFIVAIIGILSPIINSKYSYSLETVQHKKKKLIDIKTEIYPLFITKLNEIKRILNIIITTANYLSSREEYTNSNRDKYVKEMFDYAERYRNSLAENAEEIKKLYYTNYAYLNNKIIKSFEQNIINNHDHGLLFAWFILWMNKEDPSIEGIEEMYRDAKPEAEKILEEIEKLIESIKIELGS